MRPQAGRDRRPPPPRASGGSSGCRRGHQPRRSGRGEVGSGANPRRGGGESGGIRAPECRIGVLGEGRDGGREEGEALGGVLL